MLKLHGHDHNFVLQIIPPKFLKYLDEDFKSNAILIGPSSDQWQVTIFKKEENIYMQNGWPQFLKYYLVVPDDFLRFTFDGENCFRVQLFAQNGCERLNFEKTRHLKAAMPSLKRTKNGSASSSRFHELKSCKKGKYAVKNIHTCGYSFLN